VNRAKLKLLVDAALLIAFPISALSGVVLNQLPGSGFRSGRTITSFLGMTRYTWRDIHYSFNLLLVLFVLVHLALSWQYLKNIPNLLKTTLLPKSAKQANGRQKKAIQTKS
jgi:thiosulfate reductase cytochrome b subunit